jgi:hypothetical protein
LVTLAFRLRQEAEFPTRKEKRSQLQELLDAALTIKGILAVHEGVAAMQADHMRNILRNAARRQGGSLEQGLDALRGLLVGIPWLVDAAAAEIASARKGQGRDKEYLNPAGHSAHEICAFYVAVAWAEFRGKPVPHTNADAQAACAALWRAAATRVNQHPGNITLSGWKPYLQTAKTADAANRLHSEHLRFSVLRDPLQTNGPLDSISSQ